MLHGTFLSIGNILKHSDDKRQNVPDVHPYVYIYIYIYDLYPHVLHTIYFISLSIITIFEII